MNLKDILPCFKRFWYFSLLVPSVLYSTHKIAEYRNPFNVAIRPVVADLSQEEREMLENPYEINSEMKRYAKEVTRGKRGLEKASAIYHAIINKDKLGFVSNLDPKIRYDGDLTAEEVFYGYFGKRIGDCAELTYLFVAMARSAGLNANYAEVLEDYRGIQGDHACAFVNSNGREILVDPAYGLADREGFDIKHKKFRILSDLEVIALHHNDEGMIRWKQGKRGSAFENIELAQKLDEDCFAVYSNLGSFQLTKGNYSKAIELSKRAVKIDPNRWQVYVNLASAYGLMKDYGESIKYARKAIELNPKCYQAYYNLYATYSRLGKDEEAKEFLEKAKKFKLEAEL